MLKARHQQQHFVLLLRLLSCVLTALVSRGQELRFSSDGTFKILQLADLHYGGSSREDQSTDDLQRQLLKYETPDLVLFTGDMVSGYLWNDSAGHGWFEDR